MSILPCCFVSLSPSSISLSAFPCRSPVPGPWCCVALFCPLPVPVSAVAVSKLLLPKLSFMLHSHCCIICILDPVCLYLFSLSPSLHYLTISLHCLCLSLLLFLHSTSLPPCKPGPAGGFFLLKGTFSLPLCLPGGSGSGFLTL